MTPGRSPCDAADEPKRRWDRLVSSDRSSISLRALGLRALRLRAMQAPRRLLRSDAHFRRRRLDVGGDVLLELQEVLLEHADQFARGLVEGRLVLPGLERIE